VKEVRISPETLRKIWELIEQEKFSTPVSTGHDGKRKSSDGPP
jgi:hypothetical protein